MFLVPPRPLFLFLSSILFSTQVFAATVTEYWNITWVTANPDGQFPRRTIGVNGSWPLPVVEVNKGDQLVLHMYNGLGDQDTGLHFHGLFQNGTTHMDGPAYANQCPVGPGSSMTYNFTVDQPGTYWYHSHVLGQYPDGLRGQMLVHDPDDPYKDQYDAELKLSISDWYHGQMPDLLKGFISIANPTGAEPVPDAALFNDSQNITYSVEPGKTYLVRISSLAAFAPQYLWFEDHTVKVVEVDGVYTEPYEAEMLYLTPAQRVSVLLTTKNETGKNYPFVGSMDEVFPTVEKDIGIKDLFDTVPSTLNPNVTGWLVYDSSANNPVPQDVSEFNPMDDTKLVPVDGMEILEEPAYSFSMNITMQNLGDGANYAFFNDITYVAPKVPTLYTVLSAGDVAANSAVYGYNTNPKILNHNDVIEIMINNQDTGKHPFHLHGHNFQVIYRSDEEAGDFDPSSVNVSSFPNVPMRRDTILTPPSGNVVLRFRADNPGVWLFHCHLEWHLDSGLVATMIEAPIVLQSQLEGKIPADHLAACKALDIPTAGNAAGNTVDLLDLSGENKPPGRIPDGFTPRGIVALTFSIVSALLGLVVIGWYGAAEIPGAKGGNGGMMRRVGT